MPTVKEGQQRKFSPHDCGPLSRYEFGVMNASPYERQPMWSMRKELETALAQAGLGEWSPRLAAAARHAMILEPGPEEGEDAPIGASRLGGMPDLPSEVPWPSTPAFSDRKVFEDHARNSVAEVPLGPATQGRRSSRDVATVGDD